MIWLIDGILNPRKWLYKPPAWILPSTLDEYFEFVFSKLFNLK